MVKKAKKQTKSVVIKQEESEDEQEIKVKPKEKTLKFKASIEDEDEYGDQMEADGQFEDMP